MARKLTSARASHRSTREEGAAARERKSEHVSVLLRESLEALALRDGDVVIDATAGMGGHSEALVATRGIKLISFDADRAAVEAAGTRLGKKAAVLEANFADMEKVLGRAGVRQVNKVLFDLGWNMTQLADGKGFSFLCDEPLVMSFGNEPRSGFTAAEILNTWDEKVLADVLYGYGEERYARRIAKAVVERRALAPLTTTLELVELVKDAVPPAYRHGRIHPATRTFQALRIAVNDELKSLEQGLASAWKLLAPHGRIAVITFHSIEDRLVKQTFAGLVKKGEAVLVYKKPVTPSRQELIHNPSARSAKLRAIEKL